MVDVSDEVDRTRNNGCELGTTMLYPYHDGKEDGRILQHH